MIRSSLALPALAGFLSFGCAATAPTPVLRTAPPTPAPSSFEPVATLASAPAFENERAHQPSRTWRDPLINASVFYDEVEFDELDFDDDLEEIFGPGIDDVERKRAGLRVTVGVEYVQGFVQIFGEEIDQFDDSDLNAGTSLTLDDLYGLGLGIRSTPTLRQLGPNERLIADASLGVNFVAGEGRFNDSNAGTLLASPSEEGDFWYFEQEIQAGVGFDIHGFRPVFGAYVSFLSGLVEDEIVTDDDDDDLRFDGVNPGLFLDLSYKHPRFPLRFGARGTVGDAQGIQGYLGIEL